MEELPERQKLWSRPGGELRLEKVLRKDAGRQRRVSARRKKFEEPG